MTMIENSPSLAELAREIREACQAAQQCGLTASDQIFRAGEALNTLQALRRMLEDFDTLKPPAPSRIPA